MSRVTAQKVLQALSAVPDPHSGGDIVARGMVSGVEIGENGAVAFLIEVDSGHGAAMEPLRQEAERAVAALPGVSGATAILTAEKAASDPHGMNKNPPLNLPVRHVIAVASGKGGVGKSTVAMNLAAALAKSGWSAGLLDADIYGPSVPRLSGLAARKPEVTDNGIEPLRAHGLLLMSMGFLVEEEKPMIWRGPMVQTALYQMLRDVRWGTAEQPLDALVIDMPPGTGDAHLTLAQKVKVAGAVIVSTPQDLALIDARKAIAMFERTGVRILGLVENMSSYVCPSCGHEDHVFGHGGARAEAKKIGVPFLGEIPLTRTLREYSDAGTPVVLQDESDPSARAFAAMAQTIRSILK